MSKGNQPTKWIACNDVCHVCKKAIKQRLNLEATSAVLCSFKCERSYWLDILY